MIFKNLFHTSDSDFEHFKTSYELNGDNSGFQYVFLSSIPIYTTKPKYIYICDVNSNNPLFVDVGAGYSDKLRWQLDEEMTEESVQKAIKNTNVPLVIWKYIMEEDFDPEFAEYEWQDLPFLVKELCPSYDCVVMKNIGEEVIAQKYTTDYCVFNPDNIIIKKRIPYEQYKAANESKNIKKKKRVYITENQYHKLFESAGVPDGMYEAAADILNDIIFNEPSEEEIENMKEYNDYDETRQIETSIGTITYTLFYDDNYTKLGEADSESIYINYAPFANDWNDWNNVGERMLPVILHELTHLYSFRKGAKESDFDYIWLNYNSKIDADIRDFLYAIDPSEINARVASSIAVFENYWYNETNHDFKKAIKMTLDDTELRFYTINYVIEQLQKELEFITEGGQEYFNKVWNENHNFKQLLYGFSLAANDKRIIGNRKAAEMACKSNYKAVLNKELNIYNNILKKYKRKIYKACWNYANNSK